jgi:hypothetical protein
MVETVIIFSFTGGTSRLQDDDIYAVDMDGLRDDDSETVAFSNPAGKTLPLYFHLREGGPGRMTSVSCRRMTL